MNQNFVRKIIENKIGRIIIALFLLIVAIPLAIWNEKRIDLTSLATQAKEATTVSENANQLVYTTGKIVIAETLGDDLFLKPGNYLSVRREVEMYAWGERNKSGNQAGEEYYKEWTKKPQNSKLFKNSGTYQNPVMVYDKLEKSLETATINGLTVALKNLSIPGEEKLKLTSDNVILNNNARLNDDYIYFGNGTNLSPQIGDYRISYHVVNNNDQEFTLFGKKQNSSIVAFTENNNTLFKLEKGNKDEAIAAIAKNYKYSLWGIRIMSSVFVLIAIFALFKSFFHNKI